MQQTGSAQDLLCSVQELTVNYDEVMRRIDELLQGTSPIIVTGAIAAHAMRNLGKGKGKELAVGQPTRPLPNAGYPYRRL